MTCFVAPLTGRYSIVAAPVPNEGRSESCSHASAGLLRASGGQRMTFELRPALAAWCQTKGLKAILTLEAGRDAGHMAGCLDAQGAPRPVAAICVGQTLLAANAPAPLGAAHLA